MRACVCSRGFNNAFRTNDNGNSGINTHTRGISISWWSLFWTTATTTTKTHLGNNNNSRSNNKKVFFFKKNTLVNINKLREQPVQINSHTHTGTKRGKETQVEEGIWSIEMDTEKFCMELSNQRTENYHYHMRRHEFSNRSSILLFLYLSRSGLVCIFLLFFFSFLRSRVNQRRCKNE